MGNLLIEVHGNLFQSNLIGQPGVAILHCISSDYALGAGFAKQLESIFKIRETLRIIGTNRYPDCLTVNGIINMVTKDKYWNKPTYETFNTALVMARDYCISNGIHTLLMPKIGCGLDKLDWNICKTNIEQIFGGRGINSIVFYL